MKSLSLSWIRTAVAAVVLLAAGLEASAQDAAKKRYLETLSVTPPPIAEDSSVKFDYDVVYVRAPRKDPTGRSKWAEVGDPRTMEPGADLMLLRPDGSEEVLVPVEGNESIAVFSRRT